MNEVKEYTEKTFEKIKHIDENGNEYLLARELMPVLEYKEWRKFDKVIEKAIYACNGSNYYTLDHFVLEDKMVSIGSNTTRKKDYKLSRYACYLIVQNCNPRIKIIALAQTYFAVQTRRQELTEQEYNCLSEDEKRLYRRNQARKGNYNLNQTAVKSGVKDLVSNPILIKNKNNMEIITEKALHQLILENIELFMKELGNSFSFIGSELLNNLKEKFGEYIVLLCYELPGL